MVYADLNNDGTINPANEIVEENNYYPFGLQHQGYNEVVNSNRSEAAEKYKFDGKELNDELDLDLYDFGARNYDAAIGRWLNVDPLAEQTMEPYLYVSNNPIFFVDPDGMQSWGFDSYGRDLVSVGAIASWGMTSGEAYWENFIDEDFVSPHADGVETDYKKNKDGSLTVVDNENINNNTDRIVRLDKKGNIKDVLIDNIAKGILKDGINFEQNNNVIHVNGTNQPTETDFQNFIVDYIHLVRVEVTGYGLTEKPFSNQVTGVLVEAHKGNTFDTSNSVRYNENELIRWQHLRSTQPYLGKSRYAKYHYHGHPDNSLSSEYDEANASYKKIPHFIYSKKYNQQYNEKGVFKTTTR
ncbi:RHS repeat domain-containing protein [Paenimyroides aestuarii]|uniref:RHS repeat-associated core domain-containing protein n=1 Tax=Paenimyroides aestuarii TaxID=2968490 RepID=A0ABY5NW55_9FLAO|nr:RHS repeat-associated core domain-containing protein [Paenimyroides aestuarii]UUV22654.1 RHS repeat-associated core domain-containing protein [Paenimyroides aestuarii]